MNKAILVGRLTRDPELRTTANGTSVCTFSIAVNRRFKNAEGGYDADFINCVAWRQQAEFMAKYFAKGRMVGVVGSIQTRNYDNKEGQKVYVTEVAVDEVHFVDSIWSSTPFKFVIEKQRIKRDVDILLTSLFKWFLSFVFYCIFYDFVLVSYQSKFSLYDYLN